VQRHYGKAEYEIFDYPGRYIDHTAGQRLADTRLAELQTQYETLHGQSNARGMATGSTFKLKDHPRGDQNREYLITGVSLQADAGEFAAGSAQTKEFFSCSFTCIDKKQQFRPPRVTPKPLVQGPQTAIVVGPAGEEICTDEHGRVKVHFHWNRHDKSDQQSSCWVRVSQYWAGKTWGTIHIPRIQQEVIVEFLEGDPDRPIITGRVYNGDQTPPYPLPDNKTQSGIKSRSSKGGASANFNEIRFEDKMGSEEVYIHAEKDQNNVVENNETTKVGNNRTEDVKNNETISIGNNRTENVGDNETISIGGNRTESVQGNEKITIEGNRTESVTKDESVSISGNRTLMVSKDETVTVDGKREDQVAKSETCKVGKDREHTITGKDTLTVGKELLISVKEKITLETGDASIIMQKDGTIQIKGKDITITGSGNISAKASSDVTIKGSSTKIN
jgi:type VI secretion system secreted protein VgrG